MKYVLMLCIKLYQAFTPKKLRGKCLFNESCSNHVYRKTKDEGFNKGIESLNFRMKNCRPNYAIIEKGDEILLITADGHVVEEKDIDERIRNGYDKK